MSIFETASRKKLRFSSVKGLLTVEQLWDLPIKLSGVTRDIKADLDTVSRAALSQVKEYEEGSLVNTGLTVGKAEAELRIEILKHIIATKQNEQAEAIKAVEKRDRRRKLVEALEHVEQAEILKMTPDQIRAELEKD